MPTTFRTIKDASDCLEKWFKEISEYMIVAEHDDSPIGVVLLSLETYPVLDKNLAMLCYIAVDERFRNRGVGAKLVIEACEFLRKKGKKSIEVDVRAHDVPARIFYTKTRFYPFWFSKGYMPHDDGVFYRRDL